MMELQQDMDEDDGNLPMINPDTIASLESLAENARKELDGKSKLPFTLFFQLRPQRLIHVTSPCIDIAASMKTLQTNITSQFTDLRRHPYRLHSVFVHRGFVNSGHYWIYIYDFKKEIWRKYNDGYVDEVVNTNDIFEQPPTAGNPPTAYYLTYVKDTEKEALVESVIRDIIEPVYEPPSGPPPGHIKDVEMTDYTANGEQSPTLGDASYTGTPVVGDWQSTPANVPSVRW